MDKQQLLAEIEQQAKAGLLTKDEVLSAFGSEHQNDATKHHMSISEILYYIGGAIVFIGICVLGYQNWDSFSSIVRILLTFGSFVAAFAIGCLLYKRENLKKISQAFFLLSGLLAPLGLNVLFKEMSIDISSDLVQIFCYLILAVVFIGSLWFFSQTILLFFGIVFGTALFHFIINLVIGQNLLMENYSKVWEYKFLVEGLIWVLLGYYFREGKYKAISGILYTFGVLAFLGSAMALGGWDPEQNAFWELLFPLLAFGVIYLGVYLKSKGFLIFGTIFLIAYILKLTAEYFTSGLGWPLALILAGFAIIGVGYWAVRINKKYITK